MISKIIGMISETRTRAKEGHLSFFRQCREMIILWRRNKIGPGFYMKARLWHRDLRWEDKLDYISEGLFWQGMQKRNPPDYHMILFNKSVEKSLWTAHGIPTPKYWGTFHPLRGCAVDGTPLCTAEHLTALIATHNLRRLCFKSLEDFGGRGFMAVDCRQENEEIQCRHLGEDQWHPVASFCQEYLSNYEHDGALIEEYIDQHEWYARINPSSANTLRIYVVWYDNRDQPTVLGGFLRAGRHGAIIDNVEGGGIYAGIDVMTGRLKSIRLKGRGREPLGVEHPDSGVRIEGEILPLWNESKALVLNAMRCIPKMKAIGFDVAVTSDGPVLLEANERSGYPAMWSVGLPPGRFVQPNAE